MDDPESDRNYASFVHECEMIVSSTIVFSPSKVEFIELYAVYRENILANSGTISKARNLKTRLRKNVRDIKMRREFHCSEL